jgi:ribosomal protein S30
MFLKEWKWRNYNPKIPSKYKRKIDPFNEIKVKY